MEFSIDRSELTATLSLAQGVVERRNTLPILANVLLEAKKMLSITATDLEVHVRKECIAKISKPGAITVGARRLFEFVRELPPGEIKVRGLDNHSVEVVSGRSRVKLVGLAPGDFPAFPRTVEPGDSSLELPAAEVSRIIDRTLFAVSSDDTRSNLSGVYLTAGAGVLHACGTDSHRLALVDSPIPDEGFSLKGIILPRKGLAEARKLVDDGEGSVKLTFSSNLVRLQKGSVELLMRLIDGEFPNYEQVVPASSSHIISVEKSALLSALRRVAVVASERARGVRLQLSSGILMVSANSPDFGEASEEIETSHSGADLEVGFNARYLTDVLAILPDDQRVQLGLTDDESPGVISSEDDDTYKYVVMPMRL